MKVLIRTVPTNEHGDADGFDFGILELTPELARSILDRRKLLIAARESDDGLSTMRFYATGQVEYFKWPDKEDIETDLAFFDLLTGLLDGDDFVILPDDAVVPSFLVEKEDEYGLASKYGTVSDVDYLDVTPNYFYWVAYPTGSDIVIETALFDFDSGLLNRVL